MQLKVQRWKLRIGLTGPPDATCQTALTTSPMSLCTCIYTCHHLKHGQSSSAPQSVNSVHKMDEDTAYEPIDFSFSPPAAPAAASPLEPILDLEAPSGDSLDSSFLNEQEMNHREKLNAFTVQLLSLAVAEDNGASAMNSTAIIDNAKFLLDCISVRDDIMAVPALMTIKEKANTLANPPPVQSYLAFLLDASSASKTVARTAMASIAIMLLSIPSVPDTIEASLAAQVRRLLVIHQLWRYKENTTCSSSLIHINFSMSKFTTIAGWPKCLDSHNLRQKLWTCKRHPPDSDCTCTTMCCQSLDGSCNQESHLSCTIDHIDYRLSRQLLDVFNESEPPLFADESRDTITIGSENDTGTTNVSGRLTNDCLPAPSVWHQVNPRPDTPASRDTVHPDQGATRTVTIPTRPATPSAGYLFMTHPRS